MTESGYQFTNDWFLHGGKKVWDSLIPQINPTRILEIGSYEGASLCYLIDRLSPHKALEIQGIRKSGLEQGQSSPASIMRMSVEMSAP